MSFRHIYALPFSVVHDLHSLTRSAHCVHGCLQINVKWVAKAANSLKKKSVEQAGSTTAGGAGEAAACYPYRLAVAVIVCPDVCTSGRMSDCLLVSWPCVTGCPPWTGPPVPSSLCRPSVSGPSTDSLPQGAASEGKTETTTTKATIPPDTTEEEGGTAAGSGSELGEPPSSAGAKKRRMSQGERATARRRAERLAKEAAAEAAEKGMALGDEQAADVPAAPTPLVSFHTGVRRCVLLCCLVYCRSVDDVPSGRSLLASCT